MMDFEVELRPELFVLAPVVPRDGVDVIVAYPVVAVTNRALVTTSEYVEDPLTTTMVVTYC